MHILDTERLRLRTVGAADAAFYLGLLNDPDFISYIGDRGVRSEAAARESIAAGPQAMQARHGFSLYLVERRSDGQPIGLCGLLKRDTLPEVDLGYAFMPRYRGQGYAFEAAAATVGHARGVLGLARLLAITDPRNDRSQGLLRKLGFEDVGLIRPEGAAEDSQLFSLDLDA